METQQPEKKITLSKTKDYVKQYNLKKYQERRNSIAVIQCICDRALKVCQYSKHIESKYHRTRCTEAETQAFTQKMAEKNV